MRKIAISIVLSLLAFALPAASPAATAATTPSLTVSTPVDVMANGYRSLMTIAASADGSKIVGGESNGKTYRSTDYGKTWRELTALTAVVATANWNASASSADGTVLYLGAFGGFIYRSQDSGATWSQIATSQNWYQIATSSNGQYLYGAAGSTTLYRSTNFGTTFTTTTLANQTDNVACSSNGQIVYTAISGDSIYKSTDYAATFTTTGSATPDWRWIATNAAGTTVLAAPWSTGHLYVSTNSGSTFATATSAGQGQWTALSVSDDGTKMMAGLRSGGSTFKSLNSGTTWSVVSGNMSLYAYSSDISSDGSRWFMANYSSIPIVSSDSGVTFSTTGVLGQGSNSPLQQTIGWSADGTRAFATFCSNSEDVCWLATSSNSGQNFYINFALGDVGYANGGGGTAGMSADGQTIIVHDGADRSFWVSRDFGATWVNTANPSGTTATWATFGISSDGSKIVAAEYNGKLLYSSNGGTSFTVSNSTVAVWLSPALNADGSVMLVARYGVGIYRSTDFAATWTNVQSAATGDVQWVGLAADGDTAIVTTWNRKLWVSHDKGATWATTSNSSTSNFNMVSVSADGKTVFASSFNNAIDYSLDSGVTWSHLDSAGIPEVDGLAMSQDGKKLMYITNLWHSLYVATLTITQTLIVENSYAPRITKIENRTPTPIGGDLIKVQGANLDDVDTLTVDGKSVEIKSQTENTLTFIAPAHAIGIVKIVLASPRGVLTFVNALNYTAPIKQKAKMPVVPIKLKAGKAVTLVAADAKFVPTITTSTPKNCSVSGLVIKAKKAGSCALKIAINVDQNDWFTKSNTGYYSIQITN